MGDTISESVVLHLLRNKHLGTNRTLASVAKKLKLSPSYLSRVFNGDQAPSQDLLDSIGIVKSREIIYRRVK